MAMLPQKRPLLDSGVSGVASRPALSEDELKVYEVISNKRDMGIRSYEIKTRTNIPQNHVTKIIKSLQNKQLIKKVIDVRNKRFQVCMAAEFEPAKEISGGDWYSEGNLDKGFIEVWRQQCRAFIDNNTVATVDMIADFIRNSKIFNTDFSTIHITDILKMLVLDNEIEECRSTGTGEFVNVRKGRVCYRSMKGKGESFVGDFASIPCGVCPVVGDCTPDGIISPRNCVYYNKWLSF